MPDELAGTITAYDGADQLGTIELEDGRTVRFGVSSCPEFFRPEPGTAVIVSDLVPGYKGRLKARTVRPGRAAAADAGPADDTAWALERRDEELLPDAFPDTATLDAAALWEAIAAWIAAHAPALSSWPAPGASPARLDALAAAVGAELPPAFVAAWRVHDGTAFAPAPAGAPATLRPFLRNLDLLSCDAIASEMAGAAAFAAGGGVVCGGVLCLLEAVLAGLRGGDYQLVNV
jgi:hypothetical protein